MDNEYKPDERIIQSYVKDKWFVSTIYRQSSVAMSDPPWFYETIVWEWDAATRNRGALIHSTSGLQAHFDICRKLLNDEPLEDTNADT